MLLNNFDFRIYNEGEGYLKGTASLSIEKDYKNAITVIKSNFNDDFRGTDEYKYRNAEIELWTGFRDKNYVKIFEGDILNFLNTEGETFKYWVKLINGAFYLVNFEHCETNESQRLNNLCLENVEVIGNIHENLDLFLKKNTKFIHNGRIYAYLGEVDNTTDNKEFIIYQDENDGKI